MNKDIIHLYKIGQSITIKVIFKHFSNKDKNWEIKTTQELQNKKTKKLH